MILDENKLMYFEDGDQVVDNGAYNWQANFKIVSALITELKSRVAKLEGQVFHGMPVQKEAVREMARNNCAAQLEMLGYGPDGMPLENCIKKQKSEEPPEEDS